MRPRSNCILQHFPGAYQACEPVAMGVRMADRYGFGYEDLEEDLPVALVPEQEREPEVHILFIGADADLAETYRMKLNLDGYRTSVLTNDREAHKMAASLK